ncbi:hypothetical protein D3C71_1946960 [compost metagenome]
MLFAPSGKFRIPNQSMLDHFRQSRTYLSIRQALQRIYVIEHHLRLVKGADHIFGERMIYSHFTANTAIMSQNGSRHLDKSYTAHI